MSYQFDVPGYCNRYLGIIIDGYYAKASKEGGRAGEEKDRGSTLPTYLHGYQQQSSAIKAMQPVN